MPDQPDRQAPTARPDWRYEEIVLACDLVVTNGWKGLNPHQTGG